MSVGDNSVEIVIGGETKLLKPTFRAAKMISRKYGGYIKAIELVSNLDFDAIVYVIAQGLDLTPKGEEGLGDKVYETGMMIVAKPVVEYLTILLNGGKRQTETGETNGSDEKGEE